MSHPEVSVIIPVFNGASTLAEAVASIRAQAIDVEIIIVDDGSTDDTPRVIAGLDGVVHLSQPNSGPSAARNLGVARARAGLIAFIDDDDLWAPGKLRLQCRLLEENPGADVTIGRSEFLTFDTESRSWIELVPAQLHYHLGASLSRRTLFDRIGTFAPEMRFSEDIDWFLRARDAGAGIVISDEVVQTIRRNGDNMTRGKTMHQLGIFETLKRSLDRRRAGR